MQKRFEPGRLWRFATLMAIILGSLAWFGPHTVHANDTSPWLISPPSLQELPGNKPLERPNYNLDCTPTSGTSRPANAELSELTISGCATYTPYGIFNAGYLQLHNTQLYGRLDDTVLPIPNNTTVLHTYQGTPELGSAYFIRDYPSHLIPHEAADKQVSYTLNNYEPVYLRDKQGKLLNVDYKSITFSKNGEWMLAVADEVVARVNLQSFEVTLFDEPYYLGNQLLAQTAVSNDGRYAVVAATRAQRFRLYDLQACTTVLDRATDRHGCPYRDLLSGLPSQSGNDLDFLELRFSSNYTLDFYRREQFESRIVWTRYTLTAAGQQQTHFEYLALGDSFASGEGAYDYKAESATCDISHISYPYLIREKLSLNTAESVACAGAIMRDIATTLPSYMGQVKDGLTRSDRNGSSLLSTFQPGYLAQKEFIDHYLPGAVTISIAGNDIGFGKKLLRCIEADTCYDSYEDRLEITREIDGKFDSLVHTYQQIKIGSTRVYALGYPHLIKSGGNCGLNVRLNNQEIELSNMIIDYLNAMIEHATQKAGVVYVDTSQAFVGHQLCEAGGAAVHGLTAGDDIFALGPVRGPFGKESYHPTALGHQLLRDTILAQSQNLKLPMPVAHPELSAPHATDDLAILQAPKVNRPVYATNYDDDLTNNVIVRDGTWEVTVEATKTILKPLSLVHAAMHSNPVVLGDFMTDEQGGLRIKIRAIPEVPEGYHTLHIYGENVAGEPVDIYKIVYVSAKPPSATLSMMDCSRTCPSTKAPQTVDTPVDKIKLHPHQAVLATNWYAPVAHHHAWRWPVLILFVSGFVFMVWRVCRLTCRRA